MRYDQWVDELEREMVVRDFIDVLNEGPDHELEPFLARDVVFRTSATRCVRGREHVLDTIRDIRATFATYSTTLLTVAAVRDAVLAEQQLDVQLEGTPLYHVMSFASFQMEDYRITAWHQIHSDG